ncbi:FHA domain-containing protein [Propionibacterium freudenreichii]|uniref:FHA domain-containing protein n=1 Tax=Propionibacterium freudenreichii TaxID=1744 RepID=UPI0021A6C18A|nr:FHA domain-containing protein [Propionibacterium freudenreichii]MCT2980755.1 FHA domain-containing protein [Propionibacterium freudenreichii]
MADEHNGAVGAPSTHLWGESAWLALDMWRISYTPGDWLMVAGPRCVVMLRPLPSTDPAALEPLWRDVSSGAPLEQVIDTLNKQGLAQLSEVAVAGLTADGVRCLLRGGVQVLDARSSQLLARGGSTPAWCDAVLSSLYLRIVPARDDGGSAMPLSAGPELEMSVGMAQCAAVLVDMRVETLAARQPASVDAQVRAVQRAESGAGAFGAGAFGAGAGMAALGHDGGASAPGDAPIGVDDDEDAVDGEDISDDQPAGADGRDASRTDMADRSDASRADIPAARTDGAFEARPWGAGTRQVDDEHGPAELTADEQARDGQSADTSLDAEQSSPEQSGAGQSGAGQPGAWQPHDQQADHQQPGDQQSDGGHSDVSQADEDQAGERQAGAEHGRQWSSASPEVLREMGLAADGSEPASAPPASAPAAGALQVFGTPERPAPSKAADTGRPEAARAAHAWFEESTGFAVGAPSDAEAFMFEPTQALPDKQAMPVVNPPEPEAVNDAKGPADAPATPDVDASANVGADAARDEGSARRHRPGQDSAEGTPRRRRPVTSGEGRSEENLGLSLVDDLMRDSERSANHPGESFSAGLFGAPIESSIDLSAPAPVVGSREPHEPAEPPAHGVGTPANPAPTSGDAASQPAPHQPAPRQDAPQQGDQQHGIQQHMTPDGTHPGVVAGLTSPGAGSPGPSGPSAGDPVHDRRPADGRADLEPEATLQPAASTGAPFTPPAPAFPAPSEQGQRADVLPDAAPDRPGAVPPMPAGQASAASTMREPAVESPQGASASDTAGPSRAAGAVPRAPLFQIVTSGNQVAVLDRPAVVGRAPVVDDGLSRAVTVPSPGHDISRTHLRIEQRGDVVAVTDLHSTNGTVINEPGKSPSHLADGQTRLVPVGTVLELGTGERIRIEAADA